MGFMVCAFSFLYFLYKILNEKLDNKKEILNKTLRFFIYSIIAVLIAAVILIPSFLTLENGRADFSFSSLNLDKNFEIQDLVLKFFTSSFNIEDIENEAMPPIFLRSIGKFISTSLFYE